MNQSQPDETRERLTGYSQGAVGPASEGSDVWPVRGVLIGEGDITEGLSGKRTIWPAETLRSFIESSSEEYLSGKFLKGRAGPESHKPMEELAPPDEIVGAYELAYEEGTGIVFQGTLVDEHIASLVEQGLVDISPDMFRRLGDFDEDVDAHVAEEILAIPYTTVVDMGAVPSNSITPATGEQMSYADLSSTFGGVDTVPAPEQATEEQLAASAVHEPTYSGATDQDDWARPAMEDFDTDDLGEIDDHFLVSETGFPPEAYGDLHLPVVNPTSGSLSRMGLQIAKSRASQTSGVSDANISQAVSIIDRLAEEEFDLDWSDGSEQGQGTTDPSVEEDEDDDDDEDDESEQASEAADGIGGGDVPEDPAERKDRFDQLMDGFRRLMFGPYQDVEQGAESPGDDPDSSRESIGDDPSDEPPSPSDPGSGSTEDVDADVTTYGSADETNADDISDAEPESGFEPESDTESIESSDAVESSGDFDDDDTTTTMSDENPYREQLNDARERIDEIKSSKEDAEERLSEKNDRIDELESKIESLESEHEEQLSDVSEKHSEELSEKEDTIERLSEENTLARQALAQPLVEDTPLSAERLAGNMTMSEIIEERTEDMDEDTSQEERLAAISQQEAAPRGKDEEEEQPAETKTSQEQLAQANTLAKDVMDGEDLIDSYDSTKSHAEFLQDRHGLDATEYSSETELLSDYLGLKANSGGEE